MQVANEIIPADEVAAAVAEAYDEPATAALIRRGFNDTYEVVRPSGRVVARVYLAGKYYLRGDDDISFELDLLEHLDREGVSVSAPIRRADGQLLGRITDAAGVSRPLALFTWAEGDTVSASEKTAAIAHGYGLLVGRMHATASTFASEHSRYRLDGEYLLEQPVRLLREVLGEEGFAPYVGVVDDMRSFLAGQPLTAPEFGYVHGDPHGRNTHVDGEGRLTAFDFDHGGFGWRAYDVVTAGGGLRRSGTPTSSPVTARRTRSRARCRRAPPVVAGPVAVGHRRRARDDSGHGRQGPLRGAVHGIPRADRRRLARGELDQDGASL